MDHDDWGGFRPHGDAKLDVAARCVEANQLEVFFGH
jgi:hypothetical protein